MNACRILPALAGLLAPLLLLAPGTARGAETPPDWPSWRGPAHDGSSPETGWNPGALKDGPREVWKVNVGKGWPTATVEGPRLFTMGSNGTQDEVLGLDFDTGKVLWRHGYDCDPGNYPGPRSTPVVSEGRVYSLSREGHLFCLDAAKGRVLWTRHLVKDFRVGNTKWGFAGAPRIEGRVLLVNAGEQGIALDKTSGKTFWASKGRGGYAAPVLFKQGRRQGVAFFSEKGLVAVDLRTGTRLWAHGWVTKHDVNAADPVFAGTRVFITSGYGKGCALLDVSRGAPTVVWENREVASHFSTPVLLGGHLYAPHGNTGERGAGLKCLELDTGKVLWNEPLGHCALTASDGKLIVLNERGDLFVAEASPEAYRELARCRALDARGAKCWNMPVLCRGRILCRSSAGDLVCIDVSE